MKGRPPSFALLSLAVVIPLMLITALAILGIISQWSLSQDTRFAAARATSDVAVLNITTSLKGRLRPVPRFDDPPVPQRPLETDPLDSVDPSHLRSIRDDASENRSSPAGLPIRALAAMKVFGLTGEQKDAEAAARVVTGPAPSILTVKFIGEIDRRFPGSIAGTIDLWKRDETARAMLERNPEIDGTGEWREGFFLKKSEGVFSYFTEDDLLEAIGNTRGAFGPGETKLRVSLDGKVISGPSSPTVGEHTRGDETTIVFSLQSLYSAKLPYGRNLQLDVVDVELGAYRSLVRKQVVITSSLLALAVAGVLAGLWFIHRSLERERRLNAMKSDFVAAVSHELRAPIGSIRLMADALQKGKLGPEAAAEFHRLISREGARLSTLIENVLDFARIEQGRREWKLEETDLVSLIRATVSLMEPLATERRITLSTPLPESATVTVDPGAIQQALVNLIDNAIKFSPSDSSIEIRLTDNRIRVTDSGPGIPAEEHVRIFEKFHRLGGELRRETQGTGIGLSLVKAIAEAHHGSVSVESGQGKGCTFTLTLPAA